MIAAVLIVAGCDQAPARPSERARNERDARSSAASGVGEPARLPQVTPTVPAGPEDQFRDVTASAGIDFVHQFCGTRVGNIIMSNGAGVVVLDYDGDGWMDLYFVNSGPLEGVTEAGSGTKREPNRLYRNRRDGTFEDVTGRAGVAGRGYGTAAASADFDRDGWPDLYVVAIGPNQLYRNRGDGTFEEVTANAGVGDQGTGIGAAWADVDNDGWLDLFVANYLTFDPEAKLFFNPNAYPGPLAYSGELNRLYRNRGDGTFEDVSARAGIELKGHRAMSVCAFDYQLDGDSDFYVCNDSTANLLWVNDGHGRFTESAIRAGVAFNALGEPAGSMTTAVGDANGDLRPDLLVSRLGYGSFYVAATPDLFKDQMMASGLGQLTADYVGWGNNWLDFDNDGDLDILVANGDAHQLAGWECLLLENDGTGSFASARRQGGRFFETPIRGRGSAVLDFDNDGALDALVTAMADRAFLLRGRSGAGGWLRLALEGRASNPHGWGAHVRVTAGGLTQFAEARCPSGFLGQSDPRLHFGLGKASQVERLEIRWPSGRPQVLSNVTVNCELRIREPESSPP